MFLEGANPFAPNDDGKEFVFAFLNVGLTRREGRPRVCQGSSRRSGLRVRGKPLSLISFRHCDILLS